MTKKHTVSMLPHDSGPAGWKCLLGVYNAHHELEEDITTDWLIIGGGFAGLAAARRLCQLRSHDRITLIEAKHIGDGPAGRNSGFMIDLPHELGSAKGYAASIEADKKHIRLNRYAIAFAQLAAEEFDMPEEAVDPRGRINGIVNKSGYKYNQHYAAHLERLEESFEMLSAQQMRDITGSEFYIGGLFMPKAVLLQPALYITSFASGLVKHHHSCFTLYENSPALNFTKQGNCWRVETPKGCITTPKIILAVNGHVQSFGFFKQRLIHVFTYASMSKAFTDEQKKRLGGQNRWGITPSDPMGSTLRRISGRGGDRLLIRNRWTFNPSMRVSEKAITQFGHDQDRSFIRRFPQLSDLPMEYRWAGRLCLSRNSVPAFGEVEDGIFSACCQNGIGAAKGTLSGIGAVDLAIKANSEIIADLQSYAPPRKLPPAPIAWLGAKAVLHWREMKAGKEL